MFGDGFFGQWRLKLMSAFTTGLIASTTMLSAGNPQEVIKEVKKELRTDGLSFSFEALEDSNSFGDYEKLLAETNNPEIQQFSQVITFLKDLFDESGLNDIDGYGSSVVKENSMYDLDAFLHLAKGNEKSFLWKIIGGEGKEFETLKMAPESTIYSLTFRMDLISAWKLIKEKVPKFKMPGLPADPVKGLEMLEEQANQMGMPVDQIVKSMTTEMSLIITMDKSKKMTLPNMPPIPQLSLSLIMKKNGNFIQEYMLNALANAPVEKSELGGYKAVILKEQLPTGTKAALLYNDSFLVLSSDLESCKSIVSSDKSGKLYGSAKFTKYSKMSKRGNCATYASSEAYDIVEDITKAAPPEAALVSKVWSQFIFNTQRPEMFMVMDKRSNGIKVDMLSNFNTSSSKLFMMVGLSVVGTSAAMILPALGKARMRAKQAKSKSHLKQMGMSVAIYYSDGETSLYPNDLNKFEFAPSILVHPGTDRRVTVADLSKGTADYMILFKPGKDNYTGAADKPVIMEKPGLWSDGRVHVVFEDGHVGTYSGKTVEEVLKSIKRGY